MAVRLCVVPATSQRVNGFSRTAKSGRPTDCGTAGLRARDSVLLYFPAMKAKKQIAIEHVLFDWDGTLLDSFEADANAYAFMFDALGISWSMEELKRHFSPNWHRVYRAARIPRSKWQEADRLWETFRAEAIAEVAARRAKRAANAGPAIQAWAGDGRQPLAGAQTIAAAQCLSDVPRQNLL